MFVCLFVNISKSFEDGHEDDNIERTETSTSSGDLLK